jgi:hypothetical protein
MEEILLLAPMKQIESGLTFDKTLVMLIGALKFHFIVAFFNSFNQLMHLSHVLLDLPNLLESFSTKFARQLLLVNFPFLAIVDMFDVRCHVVRIQKALVANVTRVVPLSSVGFLEILKVSFDYLKSRLVDFRVIERLLNVINFKMT